MSDYSVRLTLPGDKIFDLYGPADITKETTEAIVNAANSSLMGGAGVDGAIHAAGGSSILAECKRIVAKIHSLPTGKAVITTGGRLPAKYVIHTVGPVYSGHGQDPELLGELLPRMYSCGGRSRDSLTGISGNLDWRVWISGG